MDKFKTTYWIGSMKIEVTNINEAKALAEELRDAIEFTGNEYSNKITDFMFAIEVDYQNYHNLDEDDWDMVDDE